MGVEFRNPEKVDGGWLPLEAYDDKEFDTRNNEDWVGIKKVKADGSISLTDQSQIEGVSAQGLWKDRDGLYYWRRAKVLKYLPRSERFEGYWDNTKERCRLPRIFVLFDDEDPRIFSRRFKKAYENREQADALIKYNYYIDNMPTHQIPEIDNEKVNRVLSMTQNTKSLRGKSSADTTTLLSQVNFDFAKTMNKIVFNKHLKEKGNDLITGQLKLPAEKAKQDPPQFGMITIPAHNTPEQFSNFCINTLQNKDEVIRAQQEIRKECNDVLMKDIYNPNITKTMRVDEFK
jgi:dynein heavy chain